jgi:hypothetical protein
MTTTIIDLHDKDYIIEGNKHISIFYKHLILKYNHPRFAQLNTKLKNNKTYVFYYTISDFSDPEIIDIVECFVEMSTINNTRDNMTCGIVKNYVDVGTEHKMLNCYVEIIINDNDKIRLLIKKDDNNLVIGKEYIINYNYLFYKNFYRITFTEQL